MPNFGYARDFPADVGIGTRSLRIDGWGNNGVVRFDYSKPVPVFPTETVTTSVWLKASRTTSVQLVVDYWAYGAQASSSPRTTVSASTEWQHFTLTATPSSGATNVVFALVIPTASTAGDNLQVAAPQVEAGDTATDWQLGGAASLVLIDQMTTSSPAYGRVDATLNLVEV
jgi:hypothetical protein